MSLSDDVIFEQTNWEGEQAFKITAYNAYLDIIERLKNLRNNSKSLEDYKKYTLEIEKIYFTLQALSRVDSQKRVTLPKSLIETLELEVGDTVLYNGLGHALLVRKK